METEFGSASPETTEGRHSKKFFGIEEANRALPLVRRIVLDIREGFREAIDLDRQHQQALDTQAPEELRIALRHRRATALRRLNDLVDELAELGVQLKDWETGSVDFPSLWDGREVRLCWKYDEEKVEYWHEAHAGFTNRQPIRPPR